MWTKVAKFIISYRLYLIVVIGLVTVVMGYYGTRVELSYEFARTVPPNDPEQVLLNKFKAQFGEDGNIIVVGLRDSAIYKLGDFNKFKKLAQRIKEIPGILSVRGLPQIQIIEKDKAHSRFILVDLFPGEVT